MTAQLDCTHDRHVRVSCTGYSIVEDEDGPAHPRISALSPMDVEIAGAYLLPQQGCWLLYVTSLLAAVAEVDFRTDHLRLFSRDEARLWVELLAHLFAKSSGRATHVRTGQRPVPTRDEAA